MKKSMKCMRSALAWLLLIALMLSVAGCFAPAEDTQVTAPSSSVSVQTAAPVETTDGVDATTGATQQEQPDDQDHSTHSQPGMVTENTQPATEPDTEPTTEQTEPEETTQPSDRPIYTYGLQVHFIDVGQADAALVLCGNQAMLIDGGNAADSSLMYAYLKAYGIEHLDYVVGTHAHEDHIGGIAGALNYATVGTVYCPVTSYSTKAFNNFVKAVQKHGKSITVPSVGTSFQLGGAKVTFLAVNTTYDTNNTSIVLRITYGNTSFLFTGDAEREVEQALINRGAPLRSTVLKVGHHGSNSSSSYQFLWNVMPEYAVISVGKGNTYGHPTDEVLSRLRDADTKLYRTDMQGHIICTSNGSSLSFTVSRNANADTFGGIGGNSTQPTEPETQPTEPTTQPTEPETQPTEPETTVATGETVPQ